MRRSLCGGTVVLALLALPIVPALAQETGTPIFKAPYRSFDQHEFGASLSDAGEGAGLGLEGFYRFGKDRNDFSVRAGVIDSDADDNTFVIGGNFRTQVVQYSESFPLDGALTLGFGGQFGTDQEDLFLLPVGISLGRRFDVEGSTTTFVPYVHPNLVPVFGAGDDLQFTLGLGVDVRLGEQWALRASGGLGDIEGLGISAAYLR
jgi:Outer membrane protein beta-barrel domain